jgi:hypothetical protein
MDNSCPVGEAAARKLGVVEPEIDVRQHHLLEEAGPGKQHRLRNDDGRHRRDVRTAAPAARRFPPAVTP